MSPEQAARLARRLVAAFPDSNAGAATVDVFADRLVEWTEVPSATAVERLIDSCRRFPTVLELREAYAAAGGVLPDQGRNMSPGRPLPPEPSPAERVAIAEMTEKFHETLAGLREPDYGRASTTDQEPSRDG